MSRTTRRGFLGGIMAAGAALCLPRRTEPKQLQGENTQAFVDEFEERARQFAELYVKRPGWTVSRSSKYGFVTLGAEWFE